MFDFDATCPHCEKQFKLNRVGLEAKEFIQCPHCRRIIKIDFANLKKNGTDGSRFRRLILGLKPSSSPVEGQ